MSHTLLATKTDAVSVTASVRRMDPSAPGAFFAESGPAAPAASLPSPVAVSPMSVHGLGGYAAGCSCEICLAAKASLRPTQPRFVPVRVEEAELVLRCYVTYHHAVPAVVAYWAVLGQFGWTVYTKRDGKTRSVGDPVGGTAAKARVVERLRMLGQRWSPS